MHEQECRAEGMCKRSEDVLEREDRHLKVNKDNEVEVHKTVDH